jgi:hypothetical protein
LLGKPEGKALLVTANPRLEDNIKMDLKRNTRNWIHLVLDGTNIGLI